MACRRNKGSVITDETDRNCRRFLSCDMSGKVANVFRCPSGTRFNPVIKTCDNENNVPCGERGGKKLIGNGKHAVRKLLVYYTSFATFFFLSTQTRSLCAIPSQADISFETSRTPRAARSKFAWVTANPSSRSVRPDSGSIPAASVVTTRRTSGAREHRLGDHRPDRDQPQGQRGDLQPQSQIAQLRGPMPSHLPLPGVKEVRA